MRNELMRIGDKTKLFIELLHCHDGKIPALMCFRLCLIIRIDIKEKVAETTLLEQSHERRFQCFLGSSGDFENLTPLVHKRSLDGLELQITSDLGVKQHFRQVSTRHDEFRDKINVEITVGTNVIRRVARIEFFVEVRQVEGCTIGSVIVIPVHVKDAHSLDTEKSGDDTLLEASSHDDGVVFAISEGFHALGEPVKCLLLLLFCHVYFFTLWR
mmetsp:Transcript_19905/g.29984  ORF Transcript_19905/g.29984 Transcript_19905/m.29984 type:complete len:214 (+) Transcript_19905:904-1545(+)